MFQEPQGAAVRLSAPPKTRMVFTGSFTIFANPVSRSANGERENLLTNLFTNYKCFVSNFVNKAALEQPE